jgi:hypothetical protein
MIIAVDFDGTICDHYFPAVGPEVPGAFKWLKTFQEYGAKLVLWTVRSDEQRAGDVLSDAIAFCRENGIEFWGVNEIPEQASWTKSPKVHATFFIDDRAVGCPIIRGTKGRAVVDWDRVGELILPHLKEWKSKDGS